MKLSNLQYAVVSGAILTSSTGLPAEEILLPDMGSRTSTVITSSQEQELGDDFMRSLRKQVDIVDDPEIEDYVQDLGYRLVSNARIDNPNYTFFVLNEPSVNAFAVPGGYVGINSGLILMTGSEDELAGVLAHEIAHVTQRHTARMYEAGSQLNAPAIAAMAAAILVATQNAEAGMAAMAATQAGLIQASIDFTRAHEQEADRIGIETLSQAGFDPKAMPGMFEKMQNAARFYGRPPEYLSTHPVTEARIAEAQARAEELPAETSPPSFGFQMARMKLWVLAGSGDPKSLLKKLETTAKPASERESHVLSYGYALVLEKVGRLEQAAELLSGLHRKYPDYIPFITELASVELQQNRGQAAQKLLEEALSLFPGSRALVEVQAETLLHRNQPTAATDLLNHYASRHEMNPRLYKLLARAEDQAGNHSEAYLALAEHYYLSGELPAAIDQLKRARKKGPANFYLASRIDARLEELESEAGQGEKLGAADPRGQGKLGNSGQSGGAWTAH